MAQLAIGVVGGVAAQSVGIPFGVGFAAGTFLAGVLLPKDKRQEDSPQLSDFEVQTSAYGRSIPKLFGTMRLAGSIIGAGGVVTKTLEESQGKGDLLAGPTVTHDEKFMTFAVLLCEGEVDLLRVWADKKIIVDLSAGGVPDIGLDYTFYRGTETQLPDPRLQEIHGAAKTPAYRGWAYVLFNAFPLTRFGNRIPNLEFEVTSNAATSFPSSALNVPPSPWSATVEGITDWALDPVNPYIYGIGESNDPSSNHYGLAKYDAFTDALIGWNPNPFSDLIADENDQAPMRSGGVAVDGNGFVYLVVNNGPVFEQVAKIDPNTLSLLDYVPDTSRAHDFNDIKIGHLAVPGGALEKSSGTLDHVVPFGPYVTSVENGGARFLIDWGGDSAIPMGQMLDVRRSAGYWSGDDILDLVFDPFARLWAVGQTTLRLFQLSHDPIDPRVSAALIELATYDLSGHGSNFNLLSYDRATHSLIIANLTQPIGTEAPLVKFDLVTKTVTSRFPNITWQEANPTQGGWEYSVFRNWFDGTLAIFSTLAQDLIHVIDTVREAETILDANDYDLPGGQDGFGSNNVLWNPHTASVWIDNTSEIQAPYKLRPPRKTGASVTLRSIVETISAEVGLAVGADTAFSALDQSVRGYIIESRMPARAAIEALQPGFFFSVVESDWVLKAVMAGGAASVTIAEDDLGAKPDPDGSVERLRQRRTLERDLPRQLDVSYFNVKEDYQLGNEHAERLSGATESTELKTVRLPIAFTPDEAATVASRLLYMMWANRTAYALSLDHSHARIDPADVIAVQSGSATFEMRVTEARLGANMIVQLDAVAEDSGVYSVSATGTAESGFAAQSIDRPGPTELFLMDIPMLREMDDDHGFYLATAAKTGAPSWHGAVVEKSSDAVVFNRLVTTDAQPAAGFAATLLGDQPRWTVWDDDNMVEVTVVNGKQLESKTDAELLDFANLAVLGNELFQFGIATQVDGNRWQLRRLLRGRFGSEAFVGAHAPGERFVPLGFRTLFNVFLPQSELNATRYFRARSIGQSRAVADDVKTFANAAVRQKPYAPVTIRGARDGPGNLTITWLRRSRTSGVSLHDSPLFEADESFQVDILEAGSPGLPVRTLVSSSQSVTYTAAAQAADFGSPLPASLDVVVYQNNATLGRGYGGAATL